MDFLTHATFRMPEPHVLDDDEVPDVLEELCDCPSEDEVSHIDPTFVGGFVDPRSSRPNVNTATRPSSTSSIMCHTPEGSGHSDYLCNAPYSASLSSFGYPMTPLEYGPTLGHSSPIASKPHDSALAEDDANFDFNPDPIGFATMNATMNATSLATATAVQSSIRGIKDQPSCAANYHPPTQPEARRQSTQAPGVYVHAAPAGPVHQPSQASRRDPPAKKKKTKVCVIM